MMKRITGLKIMMMAVAGLLIAACQHTPPQVNSAMNLHNPERNVLCDQYVCANTQGLSQALTAKYLGESQAQKVFAQGNFDMTQFTFENGVFCDTKVQRCYVDRYFGENGKRSDEAKAYTQALFQH